MRVSADPAAQLALTPAAQKALIALGSGHRTLIRTVRGADEPAVQAFLESLPLPVRRMRFFRDARHLREVVAWPPTDASQDHFGLVAVEQQVIVGHAAYVRMYGARAAAAVEVSDHMRHLGLGTRLVTWLAIVAEQRGITHFVAEVLAEDSEMLAVFNDGFAPIHRYDDGVTEIEFPTSNWKLAHQRAAGDSLDGSGRPRVPLSG